MQSSAEQILTAALALPESERLEVAEALLVSLQSPDRPPFDDSWRDVIRRRSAELASGQVAPIPWAEVKRRARKAAGG
jgi:putative addiction module component (TIGR02574 family)